MRYYSDDVLQNDEENVNLNKNTTSENFASNKTLIYLCFSFCGNVPRAIYVDRLYCVVNWR